MSTQTQTTTREPLILVVDGHSMVFRAWFALSRGGGLTNSAGQQTHGAYGFLRNLIATIREYSPTHIAVTFDTRGPTFRDELFDEYKAQRPPIDPELHAQIPMVESVLEAMKIPVYAIQGFEADDVVGTIVRKAETENIRSLILTGDADQLQLVTDEINLLMYSGFGDTRVYDIDGVKDRYDGLGPDFVAEIKALEGDPSDNIPGIPKIGPKAARTVLNRFGHFDNLYENLDAVGEIPSKELRGSKSIMNRLRDGKKIAYDGLKLTTIVTDVPIEIDFDQCRIGGYDRADVVAALTELGFGETIVRSIPTAEDAERGVFPLPITGRQQGDLFADSATAPTIKRQPLPMATSGNTPSSPPTPNSKNSLTASVPPTDSHTTPRPTAPTPCKTRWSGCPSRTPRVRPTTSPSVTAQANRSTAPAPSKPSHPYSPMPKSLKPHTTPTST